MPLKLLAITDGQHTVNDLAAIILEIKEAVDFVLIRELTKSAQELILLTDLLIQGGVDKRKIVIHDRLDLAILEEIPNLHLPGHGLPVKKVREKFPTLRIGQSIHSIEEARQAERDGADYVLYGHIYETKCKPGKPPRGFEELQLIKRTLIIPVYAIGGITLEKIDEINKTNIDGAAVMSGIFSAENPKQAALMYFQKCKGDVQWKNPTI